MHKTKPHPATDADIEALPTHVVGEILYGVLHTHPHAAPRHAVAANRLGYEITGPLDRGRGGPGGWIFMVGRNCISAPTSSSLTSPDGGASA